MARGPRPTDLQAAFVELLNDDQELRMQLARVSAQRVLEREQLIETATSMTDKKGQALRAALRLHKKAGRHRDHARAVLLYGALLRGPTISLREALEFVASGDRARPIAAFKTRRPQIASRLAALRIVARECGYDSTGQAWDYLRRHGVEDLPPRAAARAAKP